MKKELVGILICTLLISVTVLPATGTINNINTKLEKEEPQITVNKQEQPLHLSDRNFTEIENKLITFGEQLSNAETWEEKESVLWEITLFYDECGLLPEETNVEETFELIVSEYQNLELLESQYGKYSKHMIEPCKRCMTEDIAIQIIEMSEHEQEAEIVEPIADSLINKHVFTGDEMTCKTVITDGKILYVGGNGSGNYTGIQDAIDNASDGDTVYVYEDSSPYYENLIVNKSISLIGEDRNTTIINGGRITHVINLFADKITISGFSIESCEEDSYGIYIHSEYNTIVENIFVNNDIDIYIQNSNNNITKNIFLGASDPGSYGIYLRGSNTNLINENIIKNHSRGIKILRSNLNNIFRNSLIDCAEGLSIETDSSYNNIFENYFYDNGQGISIFIWSLMDTIQFPCMRNNISNNLFLNNRGAIDLFGHGKNIIYENEIRGGDTGIFIDGAIDNTIEKNIISGSEWGIVFILFSKRNYISNNIIQDAEIGIFLWLFSHKNTIVDNIIMNCSDKGIWTEYSGNHVIKRNNFINNNINAYFVYGIPMLRSKWEQNYWDDANSKPYLILGELCIVYGRGTYVPIECKVKIPWFNFDWHPAQEPYDIPSADSSKGICHKEQSSQQSISWSKNSQKTLGEQRSNQTQSHNTVHIGGIKVTVKHALLKTPLEDTCVAAWDFNKELLYYLLPDEDETGMYLHNSLPVGEYFIGAGKEGYIVDGTIISIEDGQQTTYTLYIKPENGGNSNVEPKASMDTPVQQISQQSSNLFFFQILQRLANIR